MYKKHLISLVILGIFVFLAFGSDEDPKPSYNSGGGGGTYVPPPTKSYLEQSCQVYTRDFIETSQASEALKKSNANKSQGMWVRWQAKVLSVKDTPYGAEVELECNGQNYSRDLIVVFDSEIGKDQVNKVIRFEAQLSEYNSAKGLQLTSGRIDY